MTRSIASPNARIPGAAKRWRACLFMAAICMWAPQRAFAWGKSGHEIVAAIAKQSLSAPELAQAQALLDAANLPDLITVSTWADDYRATHAETFQWHFVDIPLSAPAFDQQRDCRVGATLPKELTCVVGKIEEFKSKLANKALPDAVRGQALAYLVHFVGDAHQPLHASNNNDRGGNDVPVSFYGQTQYVYNNKQYNLNLHYLWDTGIIARRYGEPIHPEQIAQALLGNISAETKKDGVPARRRTG